MSPQAGQDSTAGTDTNDLMRPRGKQCPIDKSFQSDDEHASPGCLRGGSDLGR
jgi:hypothetical protein